MHRIVSSCQRWIRIQFTEWLNHIRFSFSHQFYCSRGDNCVHLYILQLYRCLSPQIFHKIIFLFVFAFRWRLCGPKWLKVKCMSWYETPIYFVAMFTDDRDLCHKHKCLPGNSAFEGIENIVLQLFLFVLTALTLTKLPDIHIALYFVVRFCFTFKHFGIKEMSRDCDSNILYVPYKVFSSSSTYLMPFL